MTAIFPALNETRLAKFFLVTLEISMLNCTYEKNALFEKKHISAPKKCCAFKFSHALKKMTKSYKRISHRKRVPSLQFFFQKKGQQLA